ncbi:MAG: hypothetical protein JSV83_07845 [Desulfobacterales bacterium]|nr:MAG: hypothetical protein JSV83_07845 [Desulfobacterales bacterium]
MKKVKLGPETLLYPLPAVLVGTVVENKPNFMTAAWCGIAASTPSPGENYRKSFFYR